MNANILCLDPDVAITIGEFEQAIIEMVSHLRIDYPDDLILETAAQAAAKGVDLCPKGTVNYD